MLAVPGLAGLRVLLLVRNIRSTRHFCVITVQLVVEQVGASHVITRHIFLPLGLALLLKFLVREWAKTAKSACDRVEDTHKAYSHGIPPSLKGAP